MKVFAGIDIGGTKVRIGLVDGENEVQVLSEKIPVENYSEAPDLVKAIADEINRQVDSHADFKLAGVGIGAPGPLDAEHEVVLDTPNTAIIQHFPLADEFRKHFEVPVSMSNDANVFVLGEAVSGAGRDADLVYGITLGTGYGHGFVWDRRILIGANGTATEYGLAPFGDGCFEDHVSGRGLVRHYEHVSGAILEGPEIYKLAQEGDVHALSAWSLLGRAIAQSLIYVTKLLDPEIIVVGGSLAAGFEFFIDSLWDELTPRLYEAQKGQLRIEKALLGDQAPIVGAAAMVSTQVR